MALKLELEAEEDQDLGDLELEGEHKLNHGVKTDGKKNNKSLVVDYFEDNVEELNGADFSQLEIINVVTSVFYDEATRPSLAKQRICNYNLWVKGRSNKHTELYTDDPGELAEEETKIEPDVKSSSENLTDQSEEWHHGVRSLSPSIIQPAPHWWERGPEVMTFIPPAQETSITDSVRGELGVEFPYALGKQVEELMADHWEEMQKTGKVGRIEDSRSQFNAMVANAQLNLVKISKAFYDQRYDGYVENKKLHELEMVRAVMEAFQDPQILDSPDESSSIVSSEDLNETLMDNECEEDLNEIPASERITMTRLKTNSVKTEPRTGDEDIVELLEEWPRKSRRRILCAKTREPSDEEMSSLSGSDSSDEYQPPPLKINSASFEMRKTPAAMSQASVKRKLADEYFVQGGTPKGVLSPQIKSSPSRVRGPRKRVRFESPPELTVKKRKLDPLQSEHVPRMNVGTSRPKETLNLERSQDRSTGCGVKARHQ